MKIYNPEIYPANSGGATDEIVGELRNRPGIRFLDTIESQLQQLVKCRHPKVKFGDDSEKYQQFIEEYLNGRSIDDIGNYVYYPWKNVVVRLLSEDEFVEVRTNRNRYKITDEEQELLRSKKVGIIGLSVGQAVAVTMAMERVAGEIRLADFDEIELTNLNRIRTDLTNLGVNKAVQVAREISEFDPYLKIKVYEDGITKDNIDSFFTEGGKLDALVEECDGLDIKIIARRKARELGIPVIMETNDRAMLDIERFDIEPDRPILHGLVEGLDPEKLRTLKTNEDKVPYMLDMIGIDQTSADLRASMLEIEQSINTWPQLASSVVAGAGIVVNVVKRILLNADVASGRFYSDFEKIASSNSSVEIQYHKDKFIPPIDYKELANTYQVPSRNNIITLSDNQVDEIVKDVLAAPSAANNQPWAWVYKDSQFLLFHDCTRGLSYWDQENIAAALGLGCAIENMEQSAAKQNLNLHKEIYSENLGDGSKPIAIFWFESGQANSSKNLYDYLHTRRTNRLNVDSKAFTDTDFNEMNKFFQSGKFKYLVITDEKKKEILGQKLAVLEQIRLLNPNGHRDFVNEIRWSGEEADIKQDGIDLRTINLTATEKAGFTISKDQEVVKKLRDWGTGSGMGELIYKTVKRSPVLLFMYGDDFSNASKIEAGQEFEEFWLLTTKLGLEMHPLTSIAVLPNVAKMAGSTISDGEREKLNAVNQQICEILGIDPSQRFFMSLRLFKSDNVDIPAWRIDKEKSFYRVES